MSDEKPPDNVVQLGLIQGGKLAPDASELNDVAITAAFAEYYRMAKAGQIAEFAVVIIPKPGATSTPSMVWKPSAIPSLALCATIGAFLTHLNNLLIARP